MFRDRTRLICGNLLLQVFAFEPGCTAFTELDCDEIIGPAFNADLVAVPVAGGISVSVSGVCKGKIPLDVSIVLGRDLNSLNAGDLNNQGLGFVSPDGCPNLDRDGIAFSYLVIWVVNNFSRTDTMITANVILVHLR